MMIVVAAVLVRFVILFWFHEPGNSIYSDMGIYDAQARRILADNLSPHDTLYPIGYPAFLAIIYALTGGSTLAVGVVQAVAGAMTCALTYPVARRFSLPRRWALCACALVALYPPFIYYGTFLLTEALSPVLFTGLIAAALWAYQRGSWGSTALVGMLFAASCVVRPNLLPLLAFLCLGAWVSSGRRTVTATAFALRILFTATPLIAVVVVLNSQLAGRFAGLSTNGGVNFFLMQSDYRGVLYYETGVIPVRNLNLYRVYYDASAPLYEEGYYYREGWKAIRAGPMRALARAPDHLREGWGLGEQGYWPARPVAVPSAAPLEWRILRACATGFFWLFILPATMMSAWLVLRGEWLRPVNAGWTLVAGSIVTLSFTFLVFLADPRVHVPFDALFIVATLAVVNRLVCASAGDLVATRVPALRD